MNSSEIVSEGDQELARRIIRLAISKFAPEPIPEPGSDMLLREDLGYHSMALVEFAFFIEDVFQIEEIEPDAARKMRTVGDVEGFILSALVDREVVFGSQSEPYAIIRELEELS